MKTRLQIKCDTCRAGGGVTFSARYWVWRHEIWSASCARCQTLKSAVFSVGATFLGVLPSPAVPALRAMPTNCARTPKHKVSDCDACGSCKDCPASQGCSRAGNHRVPKELGRAAAMEAASARARER